MRHWYRKHKAYIGVCAAVVAVFALLFALGISCPIKYVTGVSCPGCGMSRATWAILRLDFSAAVYYHPLCFAMPLVAAGLIFTHATRRHRAFSAILFGIAAAMIAVYLYRLHFLEQDVVVADVGSGLVARIFRTLRKCFE